MRTISICFAPREATTLALIFDQHLQNAHLSMILGFRHKNLERLFERDKRQGVPPGLVNKIVRILARLDEATQPGDMNLPGYQLHKLRGRLEGHWAVNASRNWRVTFRFTGEDVTDVNLIDYH